MGLNCKYPLTGGCTWTASGGLTYARKLGQSGEPAGAFTLTDGTGSGQANFVYAKDFSIAATTMLTLDMKGGAGELDAQNVAMAATAVKLIVLEITTPGASTSIRFGPQNQTNAAQLWFQDVTANFYMTVLDKLYMADARAGWAIGASTKNLCLYNPGASTVAGKLRVVGVK